jgi:cell wall assembly regulator SMI1
MDSNQNINALPRELADEVRRLRSILASIEVPFEANPPAKPSDIALMERKSGIEFDPMLRALWQFSNGSKRTWFAVTTDQLTGCRFASASGATEIWEWTNKLEGDVNRPDEQAKPDARIKNDRLFHRMWFPFAEFNGFSTAIRFDADPAPAGSYGQIIAYQHDPDAVYYVAPDFLSFFRKSNDLLEAHLTEIFFLDDEYERICHMSGLDELKRQLARGLDVNQPNWRGRTLLEHAKEKKRSDIVEYLIGLQGEASTV